MPNQNILNIIIYGELYSKKNSKRIVQVKSKNSKTRTVILPTENAIASELDMIYQLRDIQNRNIWDAMCKNLLEYRQSEQLYPIHLEIKIFRKTRRRFDYNNITQGLFDSMVKAGYIKDDSADYLVPHYQEYEVDNLLTRTELRILTK